MLLPAICLPKMSMGVYSGLSVTFAAGKSNIPINLLQHQGQPEAPGLFMSLKSGVHCISVVFAHSGQESVLF